MRFIIILVLSLNLIWFGLNIANPCVFPAFDSTLQQFFTGESLQNLRVTTGPNCIGRVELLQSGSVPAYSDGVTSSLTGANNLQQSGTTTGTPGFSFIDAIQLGSGFMGLITGLNIFAIIYQLQLPGWIGFSLALLIFCAYWLAIAQFVRNGFVGN